jgi:RNA polymerase sigma factor (sigma-70 family)
MGAPESDAGIVADSLIEPARFAALYERHLMRVTSYLARRVGSGLAEDLTAEVFVRAFRGRRSFQPRYETALPWLLGIAANLVADHRRAEKRRLAALERVAGSARAVSNPEVAVLAPGVIRELRRLPAADRDTLLLVVWGELSYEETAAALAIPVGTVRSRIARARRRLAGVIGDQAVEPDPASAPAIANGEANG